MSQIPPGASVCTTTWNSRKRQAHFTLCTNHKHPRLVSIYLLTNPCHQGLTSNASMGSVWLRTISLNSRNISEKQTLQRLPYGERRATTANHNQCWERESESEACVEAVTAKRARQAAIWTQALYKTHNFELQEPGGLAYISTTCASGGSWAQRCCCCSSSSLSPTLWDSGPTREIHYTTNCLCCHVGVTPAVKISFIYVRFNKRSCLRLLLQGMSSGTEQINKYWNKKNLALLCQSPCPGL